MTTTTHPTTETDPTGIEAALAAAIAESKTPAGIAKMLDRLADSEYTFERMSPGAKAIVGGAAAQVRTLLAADDPYAALGRLTVEMFKLDTRHHGMNWPITMVAAVKGIIEAEG